MPAENSRMESITAMLCIFPCFIAITIIFLVLPILLIVIGATKLSDCEIDPKIPIWMISLGGLMLFERLLGIIDTVIDRKFQSKNPKPTGVDGGDVDEWKDQRKENQSLCLQIVLYLVRFLIFAGTITGCVFTFSIYDQRQKCNSLVFWTSFLYCCGSLAIYALAILCICCCFCILGASR